jgi:hypothetical protein
MVWVTRPSCCKVLRHRLVTLLVADQQPSFTLGLHLNVLFVSSSRKLNPIAMFFACWHGEIMPESISWI